MKLHKFISFIYTMFKGFCPFLKSKASSEIKYWSIDVTPDNTLYLRKLGYTTTSESLSKEDEESIDRQLESQGIILETVLEIAEKDGISPDEAQKKLFGLDVKEIGFDDNGEPIIEQNESNSQISMFKWMGKNRFMAFSKALANKQNNRDTIESIATGMIQNRMLYPVVLTKTHKARSKALAVQPVGYVLEKGSKVQFGEYTVTLADSCDHDEADLTLTDGIPTRFDDTLIGFVLNKDDTAKQGFPDWDVDATQQYLPNAPIDVAAEIYQFYMTERSMPTDGDGNDDMTVGKSQASLNPSEEQGNEQESTTNSSTPESSDTELVTQPLAG